MRRMDSCIYYTIQYIVFSTDFPLGTTSDLSEYLKRNKHLKTLFINRNNGLSYLKLHKRNTKKRVKLYFTEWCKYRNEKLKVKKNNVFEGITH